MAWVVVVDVVVVVVAASASEANTRRMAIINAKLYLILINNWP